MDITQLEPQNVWQIFSEICATPHCSGNEKQLSCHLAEKAEKLGFKVKQDKLYNLRIDRPSAHPGAPRIILQGHLDMVPQAAPGKIFDFSRDPVTPVIDGDRVRADGTTLGADDGIGVAIAFALLADESVSGNISCLFTVDEEVGLLGAGGLAPEFLDGDILINLDHGDASKICIGCAGGIRMAFDFAVPEMQSPEGKAVKITLSGLPGGHSGVCIHEKRGNALLMLARIVKEADIAISSFEGGTVDNAIPSQAVITAVLSDEDQKQRMFSAAEKMKQELAPEFTLALEITPADTPAKVWEPEFQTGFLEVFSTLPNAVKEFAPEFGVPLTSSNAAVIKYENSKLHLVISARSLDDAKRKIHTDELQKKLAVLSPEISVNSEYPGWKPDKKSKLPELAVRLREELTGKKTETEVIHAGLEAGIFAGKNPSLEMISTSPDDFDIHTWKESVSISSVREFYPFIKALLNKLTLS